MRISPEFARGPIDLRRHLVDAEHLAHPQPPASGQRAEHAQQHGQALFLHGRVKPADDRDPGQAEGHGEVVGLDDQVAGARDGAKQRHLVARENLQIATGGDGRRRRAAEQAQRLVRIARRLWPEPRAVFHRRRTSLPLSCAARPS